MSRPRRSRHIGHIPDVVYFKPQGIRLRDLSDVTLELDELEALRLSDHLGFSQEECSEKMDISQPTFHRIIRTARKKVADAIVNGKAIKIISGDGY